jgi:hypothetical protein
MKICNHYSIIQKEFPLPAAGILLWQYFSTHFQKNLVRIGIILLQPQILLVTTCPDAATFSMSALGPKLNYLCWLWLIFKEVIKIVRDFSLEMCVP